MDGVWGAIRYQQGMSTMGQFRQFRDRPHGRTWPVLPKVNQTWAELPVALGQTSLPRLLLDPESRGLLLLRLLPFEGEILVSGAMGHHARPWVLEVGR